MIIQQAIQEVLDAVCPTDGVSFGRLDDKSTWRIDFKDGATDEQKAAAHRVVAEFDTTLFGEGQPDVATFIAQIAAALGDPLTINAMMKEYPGVYPAIMTASWGAVSVLLGDALAKGVLTKEQYAQIQAAAKASSISITWDNG